MPNIKMGSYPVSTNIIPWSTDQMKVMEKFYFEGSYFSQTPEAFLRYYVLFLSKAWKHEVFI